MKKKIYKLKKWLTLEETAKRLSSELEDDVKSEDVIHLIADKMLKVSVFIPQPEQANKCYITEDLNEVLNAAKPCIFGTGELITPYTQYENGKFIRNGEYCTIPRGIYEYLFIGSSIIDIENLLDQTLSLDQSDKFCFGGIYIKSESGEVFEIQDEYFCYENEEDLKKHKNAEHYFYPCASISNIKGAFFCVQTKHINEFLDSLEDDEPSKLSLDNALYLIAEMLRATKSKSKKWKQENIIDEILLYRQNNNEKINGLEKRMIEEYFSTANKKLKSN